MASPFKTLQCSMLYDNSRLLSWTYDTAFSYPTSFTLIVENSRPGGPWEVLSTQTVNTTSESTPCSYNDTRKRNYNKHMEESYRLHMVIGSGASAEEYVSRPVDAGILISYPFSAEANNAISNIQLAIRQSGCPGVLLKRKTWGARCPECTDFNGQMSVNEHCPGCFGTGIVGGYYNGISLDIIKDQIQQQAGADGMGYGQAQTIQARCIAYPFITDGDVWVEKDTNIRYSIAGVQASSTYKTVPLVYSMTLRRLEYSDAAYSSQVSAKVTLKDVWDSAAVDYTAATASAYEAAARGAWEDGLSAL